MARKEIDITITDAGRDQGKTFHLKEMPALRAEKWAMKAFTAVARSGVDIGQAATGGMQALAILGIEAITKVQFEDVEPLLEEMMDCISIKPNPQNHAIVRPLIEDDIEEVATILQLRKEVLNLHIGFFQNVTQSPPISGTPSMASNSSNTPISQNPSVRFSQSRQTKPGR